MIEIGDKDKVHDEKISSIIFNTDEKNGENKQYLWSSSKLDISVWEI